VLIQYFCIEEGKFDLWSEHHKLTGKSESAGSSSSRREQQKASISAEVLQYLQCPLRQFAENPLEVWENMKSIFPNLSVSVPSERLFSKAGQVLTQQRNRLKGKGLSKLLLQNCPQNFFFE
jgi:hypothetical protein